MPASRRSRSPTAIGPDERRLGSPRPDPATSRGWRFARPWDGTKGRGWPRSAWPRALRRTAFRIRPGGNADEITEHLDQPAAVQALVARLPTGSRLALSLFAAHRSDRRCRWRGCRTRWESWEPSRSRRSCSCSSWACSRSSRTRTRAGRRIRRGPRIACEPGRVCLRVHPAVPKRRPHGPARGRLPSGRRADRPGPRAGRAGGDPPAGALWQRVGAEPLRQTQQGDALQARPRPDRRRTRSSPARSPTRSSVARLTRALAGPGPPRRVDRARTRRRAAAGGPARILDRERGPPAADDRHRLAGAANLARAAKPTAVAAATRPIRPCRISGPPCCSGWPRSASRNGSPWTTWPSHLRRAGPAWDRLSFEGRRSPEGSSPRRRRGSPRPARASARPGRRHQPLRARVLESILLGAAYPLGLVRAAEETGTGRRVVQLTPLGRYVLAVGPDAAAPPGLRTVPVRAAELRGDRLSPGIDAPTGRAGSAGSSGGRRSGRALELKLTRESIVHGLDGGLTPEWMLETLTRHSQRPLPAGVIDAVSNWASAASA